MPSAYKNNTNKNKINVIFLLTLSAFSGKLYPVSERNTMKNTMTITEIRKHMADKRKREAKTQENLKRIGEAAAAIAAKADTFTLNGNTYTVNNDPAHKRSQLAGYCGNNPK